MYHLSKDKRSIESSRWIIGALTDLINEGYDYHKINISAICERAKIGRVTFYRHYDSIDDVLQRYCDEIVANLKEYCEKYFRQSNKGVLALILKYFYANPLEISLIFKVEKSELLKKSFLSIFFNSPTDVGGDYISNIRTAIFIATLEKWIADDTDLKPEQLTNFIRTEMVNLFKS